MKQSAQKKDTTVESNITAEDPPAVSLEEALLACMPADAPAVASLHNQGNGGHDDDDTSQSNTSNYHSSEKENEDEISSQPTQVRNSAPLQNAILGCMPGAFQIPGPFGPTATTTGDDYVDPLDPLHVMVEEEENELRSVGVATSVDIEREGDQQQTVQTNIVSAYRVAEQAPIVATPLKDNRARNLIYGFLVTAAVALIVGLSVGLTTKDKQEQASDPEDRLVSSVLLSAKDEGLFVKADRYIKTENGNETDITMGSAVINYCEVLPCHEGGCDFLSFGKVYKPGCCRGDDCDPSDKCGYLCPERGNLCHPSYIGCRDASCFECERGPDGEELYRYRSHSLNVNCLRTGVAIGFNDEDDTVEHIYKWAIGCGYVVHGGAEWLNLAPGEYVCVAVRSGEGIAKTIGFPLPCQLIQLVECGCAPDDIHTFGFPPPNGPCKTKHDCSFLCGDAGEEKAKTLCDAFSGIEWWEGDNPMHQSLFMKPEELFFGNDSGQRYMQWCSGDCQNGNDRLAVENILSGRTS